MGKKKICPNCGTNFKKSRTADMKYGTIVRTLKTLNSSGLLDVAGINEKAEEIKDFCPDCKKEALRSFVKPYAQMLGKAVEDW